MLPVYGTQAPDYTGPYNIKCFDDRALHHAHVLVRTFRKAGVHLVGLSFGGKLIVAIAGHLKALNVPTTSTMLDPAPATVPGRQREIVDHAFLRNLTKAVVVDLATRNKFNCTSELEHWQDDRFDLKIATIFEDDTVCRQIEYIAMWTGDADPGNGLDDVHGEPDRDTDNRVQ